MKKVIQIFSVTMLFLFVSLLAKGQVYELKKNKITFFSEAPLENIDATSEEASALLDTDKKQFAFNIKMQSFDFKKELMKEHFNEKYLESDKYPKATFTGNVINFIKNSKGIQPVTAKGKLTIHGVTRDVEIPAKLEITSENKVHVTSTFVIKLEDYNITRPKLVWQNLAEQVEVKVDFVFDQKKNEKK
jgi:polyisoprenoid-binding protein YceI